MRIAVKAAGTTHAAVRKEAVEDPRMNGLDMMGFMIAVLKQWKKVERKLSAIGNKKKVCECIIYIYIHIYICVISAILNEQQ